MSDELTIEQNQKNAKLAQKRVNALLKRQAELAKQIHKLAVWVEDNVDCPDAVSNILAASGHAHDTADALALEASISVAKAVDKELYKN